MAERAFKYEMMSPMLKLYNPHDDCGSSKEKRSNNKQRGMKSEVYPYEIEDIHRIVNYFIDHEKWIHYLAITIGCNMARRIGDILSLKWFHFFNPASGKFRNDLYTIVEDKTDKLANPHINSAVREAIDLYCQKTGCNPHANYDQYVFMQLSGTHK